MPLRDSVAGGIRRFPCARNFRVTCVAGSGIIRLVRAAPRRAREPPENFRHPVATTTTEPFANLQTRRSPEILPRFRVKDLRKRKEIHLQRMTCLAGGVPDRRILLSVYSLQACGRASGEYKWREFAFLFSYAMS